MRSGVLIVADVPGTESLDEWRPKPAGLDMVALLVESAVALVNLCECRSLGWCGLLIFKTIMDAEVPMSMVMGRLIFAFKRGQLCPHLSECGLSRGNALA
jgi:hypothetical protein